jgi:CBS domain-containing protein
MQEHAMSQVAEIMSTDVQVVGPQQTLQQAAQLMDQLDVGALPVCDGRRLLGMVTDRDLTIRGTAAGLPPGETKVEAVMSPRAEWCTEDQDVDDVLRVMAEAQVRRLPVVNADRELVGIVSLGDFAQRRAGRVGEALREISMPAEPDIGSPS